MRQRKSSDEEIEIPFSKDDERQKVKLKTDKVEQKENLQNLLEFQEEFQQLNDQSQNSFIVEEIQQKENLNNDKSSINSKSNQEYLEEETLTNAFIFEEPQNLGELITSLLDVTYNQLFILESINRKEVYDKILSRVWRHQMNSLDRYQRFELMQQLINLKHVLQTLRRLQNGLFCEFFNENIPKNVQLDVKEIIKLIVQDLEFSDVKHAYEIQNDIKCLFEKGETQIFRGVLTTITLQNNKIFSIILRLLLFSTNFEEFIQEEQQLSCLWCNAFKQCYKSFYFHIVNEHFVFIRYLYANQGRCMNQKCQFDKNKNCRIQNLNKHLLESHSQCFNLEKAFRFIFNQNNEYYGSSTERHYMQKLKKSFIESLNFVDQTKNLSNQFENWCGQKKNLNNASKLIVFKQFLIEKIPSQQKYLEINEPLDLDKIAQFQLINWNDIFGENTYIRQSNELLLNQNIPQFLKEIFEGEKLGCLEFQEKFLRIMIKKTQLHCLWKKLIMGYFNQSITIQELGFQIKELQIVVKNISELDIIYSNKVHYVGLTCKFNNIICNKSFDSYSGCFEHYHKAHLGFSLCLSSNNCKFEIIKNRIDQCIEHCHDNHKSDFLTLTKNYLKQQKVYYLWKTNCSICKIKLETFTDTYWKKINHSEKYQQDFKCNIQISWSDILRSYYDNENVSFDYLIKCEEEYEDFIKNQLKLLKENTTFNRKGEFAVCQRCKQSKMNKFSHLNEKQFEKRPDLQLLSLCALKCVIQGKTKEQYLTFPHLIGNLYAYKRKPMIMFEGTGILYQIDSEEAKLRLKMKLVGNCDEDRISFVNSCKNHFFLSNHTYKLIDMSKQLIRQQELLLRINKEMLLTYLDKQEVSEAQDKLELEFSKTQDLILFDNLMHRTQIQYVISLFRDCLPHFFRDLQELLGRELNLTENLKILAKQQLQEFLEINQTSEKLQFWKGFIVLFMYSVQINDALMVFGDAENLLSILELMLFKKEENPLNRWVVIYTLKDVRNLIEYAIHPLYLGILFQKWYNSMEDQLEITQNLHNSIKSIFQTLSLRSLEVILPNSISRVPLHENIQFRSKKQQLFQQKQYILDEMIEILNDQQYIDMKCRVEMISEALTQCLNGQEIKEYISSDLRWSVQIATLFLSSLKAQYRFFRGKDQEVFRNHLNLIQGLEEELKYYYQQHEITNNFDYLTTDYRDLLQQTVQAEFPINRSQYTEEQMNRLSGYPILSKMHMIFYICEEEKLENLPKVHQTLRETLYQEPYFSINPENNNSTFQKELEYALFPHLYPKAQGGMQTKVRDLKQWQLIVNMIKDDRDDAQNQIQNLEQIRQQNFRTLRTRNEIQQTNSLEIGIRLYDFKTPQLFGNSYQKPFSAIYEFVDDPFINPNQSMAFLYNLQRLAPCYYQKLRLEKQNQENQEEQLPEVVDLNLIVINQAGNETILRNHVENNIQDYLNQNQNQWDNVQRQYWDRMQEEVLQMKRENRGKRQVETFLIQQQQIFLNEQVRQMSQNRNLQQIVEQLRNQHQIRIGQVDRSEEQSEGSQFQILNQVLSQQSDELIRQMNLMEDNQPQQQQQMQIQQNQQQQLTREQKKQIKKDKEELALLSRRKVHFSEDIKFRLNCSFTQSFQTDMKWIFWRYFEWMKQSFYCYSVIVNKQKGMKVIQDGTLVEQSTIPPIFGSSTHMQQLYKQLRAYLFQEGPPLLMLTITSDEFKEKTFKNMRGMNFFDLEDQNLIIKSNKKTLRDPEVIQYAQTYVKYYNYLMKHLKKIIKKSGNIEQRNPYVVYELYNEGMFGKLKTYFNRVEWQERGSIHYHILLFIETNDEGEYEEDFLLYLKGLCSCFNLKIGKDKKLIEDFNLYHKCSTDRCQKVDDLECREGFPHKIPQTGFVNSNYPLKINLRRQNEGEENIITYMRSLVKYFNSNIQIVFTQNDFLISYLTKYLCKEQNVKEKKNKNRRIIQEENKSHRDLIKEFLKEKRTSLQEAYFAFEQEKVADYTFKVIKISQNPLLKQHTQQQNAIDQLITTDFSDLFESQQVSNSWHQYLRRPLVFEHINLGLGLGLVKTGYNCLLYDATRRQKIPGGEFRKTFVEARLFCLTRSACCQVEARLFCLTRSACCQVEARLFCLTRSACCQIPISLFLLANQMKVHTHLTIFACQLDEGAPPHEKAKNPRR